ncbi:MAG: FitA-like ribbon-helix-helix domain-containing protein [Leptospirales bacterium]
MPTHLSVKNVPDEVLQRLKARAERHHRSLQGELLSILEEAVAADAILTPEEVLRRVSERALTTPSESVQMIRGDRDAR